MQADSTGRGRRSGCVPGLPLHSHDTLTISSLLAIHSFQPCGAMMPENRELVAHIGETFNDARRKGTKVPRDLVRSWIRERDLEVQCCVYAKLAEPQTAVTIEPPLSVEEAVDFLMTHLGRCFVENLHGEWCRGRYVAGWDLVGWFLAFWKDRDVAREVPERLKEWMAGLYRDGDSELRECLVTATLEHLFERKPIARFFSDWADDPVLGVAYKEAMLWPEHGGRAPLVRSPEPKRRKK